MKAKNKLSGQDSINKIIDNANASIQSYEEGIKNQHATIAEWNKLKENLTFVQQKNPDISLINLASPQSAEFFLEETFSLSPQDKFKLSMNDSNIYNLIRVRRYFLTKLSNGNSVRVYKDKNDVPLLKVDSAYINDDYKYILTFKSKVWDQLLETKKSREIVTFMLKVMGSEDYKHYVWKNTPKKISKLLAFT